uniref:Sad1 and UNC84 domain containing 2 n=1 Tax=Oryctolagus cuniculus TaxID=9986 RepID=A0A5F9D5W5_RABIT
PVSRSRRTERGQEGCPGSASSPVGLAPGSTPRSSPVPGSCCLPSFTVCSNTARAGAKNDSPGSPLPLTGRRPQRPGEVRLPPPGVCPGPGPANPASPPPPPGAWYFYPFGLQSIHPAVVSWWAARDGRRQQEVWESRDAAPHFQAEQRLLSHVHSLERRLEALAAEFSSTWQKEAVRLERLELRQGAAGQAGGGLSQEDTLALLDGLVSRREAALKEDLRKDAAARLQEELAVLRAEQHRDVEDLFHKIVQAAQESEARVQQLKSEWQRTAQESTLKELGRLEGQLVSLRHELEALALKQSSVADEVGLLPQRIQAVRDDVESQVPAWITQFLHRGGGARTGLLQREELQAQLRELESKILAQVAETQGTSAREAAAALSLTLQREGVIGVTEEQVHRIVKQALQRYSEDRIGMVDYALESGGASVISTRCSETYETKTALLSLFGIPLWYHSQSPRVILQPDVHPGNCWAFQGPQGFAVVRLSARIRPTAVTLEHVPKALSPNSTISSAPRDFAVFGFDEDLQQEGTLLGKFTYDQDGEPIQTFYFQVQGLSCGWARGSVRARDAPCSQHSPAAGWGYRGTGLQRTPWEGPSCARMWLAGAPGGV